ncbi:MAG: leucyl aminopeptidase [Candidatus Kapabacteria bacterium]|nr:leucyl aminopeptidase [Candidatus Kapabacteria bacterium]
MSVSCSVAARQSVKSDALIVFVPQSGRQFNQAEKALVSAIPHLTPLFDSKDFTGKSLQTALAYCGSAAASPRIILAGLGETGAITIETIRRAAAAAAKRAAAAGCQHIAVDLQTVNDIDAESMAQAVVEGVLLSQYAFDKYKTISPNSAKRVKKLTLITDKEHQKAVAKGADAGMIIVDGVTLARDLANAPNCEIYPETLAKKAQEVGRKAGFKTTVLDKKKIETLKMGGLLGVNQGSVRPPVFIVMEYMKGAKTEKPLVLVGKGVTFDTGGISIKPAPGMSDMKSDMHGAATVIGTMQTIARLGIKRNVVGIVPATENMPSGTALVPGDIITFMNGKTAEIDNTDAEGRLILADALCYADRYKPSSVIDLATLTGAIVIALGNVTTGMMGTDGTMMNKLREAAAKTNEYVGELPLHEEYEELISSDYADIKNSGGRSAGSITAALFLKHFVSYPWVHLDIAGTAIQPKASHYTCKGGSGVGVRLLTEMLRHS